MSCRAAQTLLAATGEADAETAAVMQAAQSQQEAEVQAGRARREQLHAEVDELGAVHK